MDSILTHITYYIFLSFHKIQKKNTSPLIITKKIIINLTSYDIVCEIAPINTAPIKEYRIRKSSHKHKNIIHNCQNNN